MIIAIIQARMGSKRFPKKTLKMINGKSLIEILLYRLSKSKKIDKIILATTELNEDDILCREVKKFGFDVFRGSEKDVLDRYYKAAQIYNPTIIVRITGDCPLVDPNLADETITFFQNNNVDYVTNAEPPTYPDGLDIEVFSFDALLSSYSTAKSSFDREHVTSYIRSSGKYKTLNFSNNIDLSKMRWTVDESEDLEVIKNIFKHFHPDISFSWKDVYELAKSKPEYFEINKHIIRNQGAVLGTGQKLYSRAKKIIPGGTMLLSKRPEMFLPDIWPSYFSKAKGCEVWDLDKKKYIDMSIMGIGTNTLGYGDPEVDESVMKTIEKGNMSTFNCPEEVYLAERLIHLHKWADMARFARSGGEANAIAIRIARAASGKDKVAICGYHGWHDWYLSSNLNNSSNLDSLLLPGLQTKGVPKNLKGLTFPFRYNDFQSLQKLVDDNEIGVVKMEVSRSAPPKKGFLESIRQLCTKNGIVLIFDECTSGFRETYGGLHKKFPLVDPDMAMFGKTLGNGYAITAVLGKKEIMKNAQETFISSTFWTERIGPTAALKTLEVMEKKKSWETITNKGIQIKKRWERISDKYSLKLTTSGISALPAFSIKSQNWLKYKTLITQEMLKAGFLASNSVYVCTEHKDDIIDSYFENIENIFSLINECENGRNIDDLLDGPVCHDGFARLN